MHVQIGPFWNVSDSLLEAKQSILLYSPGNHTIPVPYNVTITGAGSFDSLSRWEWEGATAQYPPSLTGDRKVSDEPESQGCAHVIVMCIMVLSPFLYGDALFMLDTGPMSLTVILPMDLALLPVVSEFLDSSEFFAVKHGSTGALVQGLPCMMSWV